MFRTGFHSESHGGAKVAARLLAGCALAALAMPAQAQEQSSEANSEDQGVIVVSGIRGTIQNSIEEKRIATEIVDSLSAEEIGDLPALSIGEALETLTGAASHREQGGATEIAVRGLGPYLGSTVINGREASNGSGDRSVNFSQFPSELFNKVAIYKTQQASFIEGGVSGQIALETIKPLDFGKRRFQADLKLNYNPQNNDISSDLRERDFGYRGTFSYVDQFQVGDGEVGISLGYSRNVTTNPEQEARTSSGFRDCRLAGIASASNTFNEGVFEDDNCDDGGTDDGDLILEIDPATGTAPDADTPFLFTSSQRSFRQNITDDERDSFFAAVQLRPSPDFEVNMDFQYSNRDFSEIRNDLVFAENRRIDAPDVDPSRRLPFDLIVDPSGAVRQFTSEQRIETNSQYAERLEEYFGGGLSLDVQASDRLKLSADFSYSQTERRENIIQTRLQSDREDIFGNFVQGTNQALERGSDSIQRDRVETATFIRLNGSQIHNFFVRDFDVTNADLFADDARTRVDLNQFRNNSIFAARGDAEYEMGGGLISSIEAGVRFSELRYDAVPRARNQITYSDDALTAANLACRNSSFPESGFLSSVSGGNAIVTNVDVDGNPTASYSGYATFDPICLVQQLEAADPSGLLFDSRGIPVIPGPGRSIANVDVREKTWAGYLQANFNGDLGSVPIRGNLGLRVINTDVSSTGLRGTLSSSFNGAGELEITENTGTLVEVTGGGSYTEYLPSFNLVADVAPDIQTRFAVYRALSRPDPSDLGFGRNFGTLVDDTVTSIADAVGTATASGNPFTQPLLSWNFDAAVEWYPNPDTILAAGVYYKSFNGGFENSSQVETFVVDGNPLETIVTTQNTTGESSRIFGLEVTAAHRLSWLPKPLDGLGFKLSYNYADSNFEFEDAQFGASSIPVPGAEPIQRIGIVAPANVPGLSKHVLSAQVYYQIGGFDFQGVYKYRSEYFQQFISTPGNLRFIGDTGVFEGRISYKVNNNIKLTLEGINLFNEPRRQFNPTRDNFSEINVYGPRYFAGVRFKF